MPRPDAIDPERRPRDARPRVQVLGDLAVSGAA